MTRQDIKELVDNEIGSRPEAFTDFLDALAEAAQATASHVEENWQDRNAAKAWRRIAHAVDKAGILFETNKPF